MDSETPLTSADLVVTLTERAQERLRAGDLDNGESIADEVLDAAATLPLPLGETSHRRVVVSLHRLANSLSDVRSVSRALLVALRSVEIARAEAGERQANHGDLLPLALTGLANRQWEAGEREASVRTGAEAVWLSAALDDERDAVSGAAWASLGLANHLCSLTRYDEALSYAAVGISANRWLLARAAPSASEELVLCLNAQGNSMSASGRPREALGSYAEAADMLKRRLMAPAAEVSGGVRGDLLMVLKNSSDAALRAGAAGEARTLLEDAAMWCQEFCESDSRFAPQLVDIESRLATIG